MRASYLIIEYVLDIIISIARVDIYCGDAGLGPLCNGIHVCRALWVEGAVVELNIFSLLCLVYVPAGGIMSEPECQLH